MRNRQVLSVRAVGLKYTATAKLQPRRNQDGYILVTLMLAVTLMAISLLAVLPDVRQQIRREREEELIHRGTAYMRAIQRFHRALGRYPSRIEDLESTSKRRFIRKRYTDPVNRDPATGKEKEFKLLHQTDILSLAAGLPAQAANPLQSGTDSPGDQAAANGDSSTPPSESSGNGSDVAVNSNAPGAPTPSALSSKAGANSAPGSGPSGQTFGGGEIVGVASLSKAQTVRVFYNKTHYNDWFFIYLEQADRGGLLTGPVNPGSSTPNLNGGAFGQGGANQGSGGIAGRGINSLPQVPPPSQPTLGDTPPQQ
jgi:type II secretory pathway pseudopilin PulG